MSFIINRWVRGTDFFGRKALLAQILERKDKPTWIMGNRRAGKTSLLRQIHHLCTSGVWADHLALYWDLQGAGSAEGLKEAFLECLEDNEEVTERLGLDIDELEDASLGELLNKFRRKAKGLKGTHLFLLIDECEELVDITTREAGILAPFRKLSQGNNYPFNLVMTGSWRMMDLDESDAITSPFLPDFLPPLLLEPFSEEESIQLLLSKGLAEAPARDIYALCLGNPHLLQVLGEHTMRTGLLETALAELKHNKVAHYFFQSNFNCLPPEPRPYFSQGCAREQLAALTPQQPYFPQVAQSALVRLVDGGVIVSPLLCLIEGDMDPAEVLAGLHQRPPAVHPGSAQQNVSAEPPRTASVRAGELPADLLAVLDEPHRHVLGDPVGATFSSLVQEADDDTLHDILDRAAPEFVRGEPADERTAVYLVGLHWYRTQKGTGPFAQITGIMAKATALAERDVPIDSALRDALGLSGKQAMILLRCLRSDPADRYQTRKALKQDLGLT